jgi:Rhodopirellula transposase DDE domain
VVNTIGSTTTRTGLTVHAELDPGAYPTGTTVPDDVMDRLPLTPHDWHGTWNYTLRPEPLAPPTPMPHRDPAFGRFPAGDKTPAWLRHPSLTGLEPAAFDDLVARYRTWCTGHPPILLPGKRPDGGPGAGGRRLSAADHLVVLLLKTRWSMTHATLAEATGLTKSRIGATLRDAIPVLAALDFTVPTGALAVTTTQQLADIAGHDLTPL